jgi:hypothetical protein
LPNGAAAVPSWNTYGKWIIDPNEVEEVFKKSKKAREDWFTEQRRVQKELMGARDSLEPMQVAADGQMPAQITESSKSADPERNAELDAKIGGLEAKVAVLEKEKHAVQVAEKAAKEFDDDLKKVLKVVDDLLGKLPDDAIDAFAKSDEFKIYQKIMDRYLWVG